MLTLACGREEQKAQAENLQSNCQAGGKSACLRAELGSQTLNQLGSCSAPGVGVASLCVSPHILNPVELKHLLIIIPHHQIWYDNLFTYLLQGVLVLEQSMVYTTGNCGQETYGIHCQIILQSTISFLW